MNKTIDQKKINDFNNQVLVNNFLNKLKAIKKRLPKSCSFLALNKGTDGMIEILAIVHGEKYYYTAPFDYNYTEADSEELFNQLLIKCNSNVSI